jgi:entericidin B
LGVSSPNEKEAVMTRYAILFATLLALSACETMGGFGRDVEKAGDAIQDTAQDTEAEMSM